MLIIYTHTNLIMMGMFIETVCPHCNIIGGLKINVLSYLNGYKNNGIMIMKTINKVHLMLSSMTNPLTPILLLQSIDDEQIDSGGAKYISPYYLSYFKKICGFVPVFR